MRNIEHKNIFYVRDISSIGGVETYVYEMCKKYHNLDIAVVYKQADKTQLERLKKYCRAYQHTNQKIICDVAIINYDVSIIDYIVDTAKIYQVIHGDYENAAYSWKPPTHERIYEYIGVTQHIVDSFKRITGKQNVMLSYNPLTPDDEEPIVLVSATRLSKIKGKDRMIKLAMALDNANINYIWYVFTNDNEAIKSPNVFYMKPRLDVSKWIKRATYLVQLSDTEACSYSINEALYMDVPVIVTRLPYLEEIGVKDGENAYIMDFDCSNIDNIVANIKNIPKFKFKRLEDRYGDILSNTPSHYFDDMKKDVIVRCIKPKGYGDIQLGRKIKYNEIFPVKYDRAIFLEEHGAVEIKK